ncbi:ribosome biogenesis protein ytm1 [Cerrena zonata]|uniref:Ribosome biogenesis protein YTM1 n=1 Tax=Cerrena zonata TaxID=2478898 RepID=A0AAW0FUC3_9APHY
MASDRSHPVVFTTQTAYSLPSQKFMIPASWKRYQLSQLVNKALSLAKPIPFDFLVRGEILRTTLGEWCSEKGIGEEETLEIEYFESVMPPQKMSSLPHEDWVSSVSATLPGHFLTASYDGQLRVFDYSQKLLNTIPLHEAPATSIAIIPNFDEKSHLVASGSHDLTARLTKISLSDPLSSETTSYQTLASLHLHTAPISSISSNASGKQLLTASWDGLIGLWDTIIPGSDEVPSEETGERKKRRKITNGDGEQRVKRKAPLNVLKSHTARVSKAVFVGNGKEAVSAGLDETVRKWDVENGVCVNTITAAAKPFLDIALTSSQQTVLAASTDRTVSQFDLRSSESSTTTTASATFMHPSTPSCIAIPTASSPSSTSNEHQFMTGAFDGVVRLWDLRSTKGAVTSFKVWEAKSGGKVLSLDWSNGVALIGGEGGVDVWRVGEKST